MQKACLLASVDHAGIVDLTTPSSNKFSYLCKALSVLGFDCILEHLSQPLDQMAFLA